MFIRQAQQHSQSQRARSKGGPDEVASEFPQRQTSPGPDDVYDPDAGSRFDPDGGGGDDYVGSMFLG